MVDTNFPFPFVSVMRQTPTVTMPSLSEISESPSLSRALAVANAVADARAIIAKQNLDLESLVQLLAEQTVASSIYRRREEALVAVVVAITRQINEGADASGPIELYLSLNHRVDAPARTQIHALGKALEKLPSQILRRQRSASAKAGAAEGDKGKAKQQVHALWRAWEVDRTARYRSKADFVRAMRSQFGDKLKSEKVIDRWVTSWRLENAIPGGRRPSALGT